MKLSPKFNQLLKQRNLSLAQLAERSYVDVNIIEKALDDIHALSTAELSRIAESLGVPERALFATQGLPLSPIIDYRRTNPEPTLVEPSVIEAVAFVEKISQSLKGLGLDLDVNAQVAHYSGPLNAAAAKALAVDWRKRWGMTDQKQLDLKSSSNVYADLRLFIERLGIFVIHYSFGTDKLAGMYMSQSGGPNVILINTTRSSKGRKLFTLAHEFCHVLLRLQGVSDSSVSNNNVEVFCNKFAVNLLAPESLINSALARYQYSISINNDSIRLLSQNLGISQQACVLRLVEFGHLSEADYTAWLSAFDGRIPAGDMSDSGGGGGATDPIKNKQTQYGHSLLSNLSTAYRRGYLDEIEIYRISGIKPKYQTALFGG